MLLWGSLVLLEVVQVPDSALFQNPTRDLSQEETHFLSLHVNMPGKPLIILITIN